MASAARGVTRVLILADAPVLRRGLVSMINETAGMQSVGTPGELRRALTLVETARPDAVVVAAGYRQNLEPLVGDLGVLDARGLPRSHGAEPALPGLYFTGFTNPISGMFRELRIDATRIARAIRPRRT